jgi:hypothetical protein
VAKTSAQKLSDLIDERVAKALKKQAKGGGSGGGKTWLEKVGDLLLGEKVEEEEEEEEDE